VHETVSTAHCDQKKNERSDRKARGQLEQKKKLQPAQRAVLKSVGSAKTSAKDRGLAGWLRTAKSESFW
jgi:hypothetical protein